MKKIISFIMVISIFSSCKIEKNADSQLTTTESNIEHVCIPLTDAQIIGLYNTLTTVQTRAVVLVSSLEEFKSYLNTSLVAVCFTATWSGPCKMYKPIYHKVSEKYTASVCRFLEVDVDESPELAELFNVVKVPTTIFFGRGGEFYLLPHKSLSDGLRIANRKRTKTKGHPFVQMTVLPPTDTRQKIILLNSYCNRYLTRQI